MDREPKLVLQDASQSEEDVAIFSALFEEQYDDCGQRSVARRTSRTSDTSAMVGAELRLQRVITLRMTQALPSARSATVFESGKAVGGGAISSLLPRGPVP